MEKDIRWHQRFSNFVKALNKLTQTVDYIRHSQNQQSDDKNDDLILDEIIKEGLIQRFEYTHELAWNTMKDYAVYQGNSAIGGSRDATREGFQLNLIKNGETWMNMIASRNMTSHTYNEETANEIYNKVLSEYYPAFIEFQKTMETKRSGEQQDFFDK